MKIFGINFGKKEEPVQKKSIKDDIEQAKQAEAVNQGVIIFGESLDHRISPQKSYLLYEKVSIIFDAVDKVASKGADLSLVIKDKDRNVVRDSEILNLLNKPNSMKTKTSFWNEVLTSFTLTNEAWFVARGNVKYPPLAIDFIEPYDVIEISKSSNEPMPMTIKTQSDKDRRTYYRELIDGEYRFFSKDGLNELIPVIGKNYSNSWRGMSKLSPLIEEVIHIKEGNKHNRALLENGMNASIIIAPDNDEIDEDETDDLRKQIKAKHQGSGNAGNVLMLPMSFKLVDKSASNRDMDYMQLIDTDESRVFRLFNIPLPLVKSTNMTQSNYEVAVPALYSDAVLPIFNQVAEEITAKILRRYKLKKGEYLTFDEFNIPALNNYQVKLMNELIKTNSVTINEVRSRGGLEKVDGADDVMISANMIRLQDEKNLYSETGE